MTTWRISSNALDFQDIWPTLCNTYLYSIFNAISCLFHLKTVKLETNSLKNVPALIWGPCSKACSRAAVGEDSVSFGRKIGSS